MAARWWLRPLAEVTGFPFRDLDFVSASLPMKASRCSLAKSETEWPGNTPANRRSMMARL